MLAHLKKALVGKDAKKVSQTRVSFKCFAMMLIIHNLFTGSVPWQDQSKPQEGATVVHRYPPSQIQILQVRVKFGKSSKSKAHLGKLHHLSSSDEAIIKFQRREAEKEKVSEIKLNPTIFSSERKTLGTLMKPQKQKLWIRVWNMRKGFLVLCGFWFPFLENTLLINTKCPLYKQCWIFSRKFTFCLFCHLELAI